MGRKRNRRKVRSLENPNVPLNVADPDDFTLEAFGASRSQSGVRVNRRRALGYPAVWRAVNLISGDVAKLPLMVYRQAGRNREPDKQHPAYPLLLRKPNDAMTAFVWKQTTIAHVLMDGNGYSYIDRDGAARPIDLLPLCPDSVEPIRRDGRLWYLYRVPGTGEVRKLPAEDVLHLRGLGFDGLRGYPVIAMHRDSLGAALAARDFSARYFRNSARPGGIIKHPKALSPSARTNLRESWERIHSGLTNAHKIAILEEGAEFQSFETKARDSQLLESREFDAREIANIFGVPTHKLGDPSKVAYNSLEQENQSYYDDTLSRWLRLFAEECHDKLLAEREKADESHLVDFDYQEIQRANLAAQTTFVTQMVDRRLMTPNEGRAVFGLNPVDGGDELPDPPKPTVPPVPPAPVADPADKPADPTLGEK